MPWDRFRSSARILKKETMSPVGEIEEGFLKKELSMSYFPWSQDFKYTSTALEIFDK